MSAITLRAYAKVNLTLEVLGERLDGYHEVRSVLQTVSLWDELTLRLAPEITLRCDLPEMETPDNLVLRAAEALQGEARVEEGVAMELRKGIPLAAGLGGGSADAAATLVGLDRLWVPDLPQSALRSLAENLGADVPFFLLGGTALVWGRGQEVMPLHQNALRDTWLLLLCSQAQIPNKTAALYACLMPRHFTGGERAEALAQALQKGEGLAPDLMVNSFEEVAYGVFPWLEAHRDAMLGVGTQRVHLAGSGPTLFTLVADQAEGAAMAERLCAQGLDARLVQAVDG